MYESKETLPYQAQRNPLDAGKLLLGDLISVRSKGACLIASCRQGSCFLDIVMNFSAANGGYI